VDSDFASIVHCEGRYEVDPIPGGKRFQGTWLVLDDGTRYVLSYRPVPEYFPFVDKRVSVTGLPYTPGRDTQHILAAHLQVVSIELAPGEKPYARPPAILPAPPLLRTSDDIIARIGRWGQVVGWLTAITDDPNTHFGIGHLKLEDETRITALYAAEELWSHYLHRKITVMSRIEAKEIDDTSENDGSEVVLIGWYAICRGVVERCGM
jgi:hypothetical protein